MSERMKRAEALRTAEDRHYNCAQSVLIPFAEKEGMDTETAYRLAACFGAGMNMGAVCGAVTGGLMALGLAGKGSQANCREYLQRMRANHDGQLDCRELLRINAEKGGEKKPHCDAMVYEALRVAEEMLSEG